MALFQVEIHLTENEKEALEKFNTLVGEKAIEIKQRLEKGKPFIFNGKPVFIIKFKSKKDWS